MSHILYIYSKEGDIPRTSSLEKIVDQISLPFSLLNHIQILHCADDEILAKFNGKFDTCFNNVDAQSDYHFDEAHFNIDDSKTELNLNTSRMRDFWYVNTSEYFAISTSQRIIVMLLKDYQPDLGTKAWMLSAGTLGPTNSWDKRISRVYPYNGLQYNKRSGTIKQTNRFSTRNINIKNDCISELDVALEDSLSRIDFENEEWLLTLSGGVDSRVLFHKLRQQNDLKCITWSFEKDLGENNDDLDISRKLTSEYNVEHDIRIINETEYNPEEILERFLLFSEGTVDHLTGYLDGFELWNDLKKENIDFVFRGDNLFFKRISRPPMLDDYSELSLPWQTHQHWPAQLERRDNESVDHWQLRLYRDYRIPTVMSSLNSVKVPFVGVINPYLSQSMLEFTSSLPPSAIVGKDLLKEYVRGFDDEIPYASRSTNKSLSRVLSQTEFQEIMEDSILSQPSTVPAELLESFVSDNESSDSSLKSSILTKRIKAIAGTYLPDVVVRWIVNNKRTHSMPSKERLLFRIYIIEKMNEILLQDCLTLRK